MTNEQTEPSKSDPKQRCIHNAGQSVTSEFIRSMFAAFEEDNVAYCVLRNYARLPQEHGNDVDILVAPHDLPHALAILQQLQQSLGFEKIGERRHCEQHTVCLSPVPASERCLKIDFMKHICWKGIPCVATGHILAHRERKNGFGTPPAGGEAVALLIKEMLMFGTINKRNNAGATIQVLATADNQGFIECLRPNFSRSTAEWLLEKSKGADWGAVQLGHRKLRRELTWRAVIRNPFLQCVHWMMFLYFHLRHRIRRRCALFVAVIGPDGSGKTTLCNVLAEWWKVQFHCSHAIHVHGGFKVLPRLKILRRLWGRVTGRPMKPDVDFTQRHSGSSVRPHSMIRSLAYLCYYLWDYVLGHLVVFRHKGKDRLVIADRYFYDYFLHLANSRLPHWVLRSASWFIPKPDLVVLLEADPEAIYRRKDELTVDEIKRQQDAMHEISRWLPNRIWVKTEKSISATAEQVQSVMLRIMSEKNK